MERQTTRIGQIRKEKSTLITCTAEGYARMLALHTRHIKTLPPAGQKTTQHKYGRQCGVKRQPAPYPKYTHF